MTRRQHILFGIHSGIPPCCIEYFLMPQSLDDKYDATEWGYLPCPDCRAVGKPAVVHSCAEHCVEFLRSIGHDELVEDLTREYPV